ncbi:hypothetical protein KAI87_07850 [Myxococcota bacterium]|nr:hypothetical protein [Myxococcota bacterium]
MRILSLSILSLFLSSTVFAGAWEQTFSADAVDSYIQGSDLKILVAAAGDNKSDVEAAAIGLEAALRKSSRLQLVMSDDALGSLSGLDDGAIAKKAAHLPVDQIFVVRVFPGSSPDKMAVVVTIYDKAGEVLSAFSGTSGQAMETQGGGSSGGVSNKAASVVASVTKGHSKNATEAVKEYEERALWFKDMLVMNKKVGARMDRWSRPVKGTYREPLSWTEFYEAAGRPELADEYQSKRITRILSFTLGGTAIAVGVLVTSWGVNKTNGVGDYDECRNDYSIVSLEYDECKYVADAQAIDDAETYKYVPAAGLGTMAFGGLLMLVGGLGGGQPVEPREARRIADEHNEKLREELGLSRSEVAFYRPVEEPEIEWTAAPIVTSNSGGLVFSLSF